MQAIKPLAIALKGKGPVTMLRRVWTISNRYGLSTAKMDQALNLLAELLQKFDCRATLPITTVALARNSAVIQKYQAQGIEFAIHGYRHIDHSQLSFAEQTAQFSKAGQVFRAQGIHFEGFRCPYLRWNNDTLAALGKNGFAYDSSNSLVWDGVDARHQTESYQRALEFYGAEPATDYPALPVLDQANQLVRIPYCLPDDESLVERLIWSSPAEMEQVWPEMFRHIHQRGELFTLGLHPERTFNCAEGLVATLQEVQAAGAKVWRPRLREVAAWWTARAQATVQATQLDPDCLQLAVTGPEGTTLLLRAVEVKTKTLPWLDGYQQAEELPCIIRTAQKPFIGVSPETSPHLQSFLRQQGYVVESTSEPGAYTFYLDQPVFSAKDERRLLTQIETADFPLVRLGRWPHGAYSAFNITGDIDALTFWDYSQRLWEK